MAICSALTKSGKPCKAHASKGSDYCHRHAPAETPESPRAIVDEPEVSTETEAPTESPEPIMSAMPVYVDKRPSPPPNARTTEPGKAQPYDNIKDLLKVQKFHVEKRAAGINGSAKDMVRIAQEKGSSLKTTTGWLGALIKKTESMTTEHKCCAVGCTAKATLGAHIWLFRGEKDEADFGTAYIVPTCKNHNSRKFDFGKYSNSFEIKAGTTCISMPPHVMYSDYKPL